MITKNGKRMVCMGLIVSILVGCCGCETSIFLKKKEDPRYVLRLGESMISLADIKTIMLEYKDVYNKHHMEIDAEVSWEETNENGMTYEEQLLYHYVIDEAITLEVLQLLASEHQITLTREEEEQIIKASTTYMEQISEEVKEYCNATLEQTQLLMKKYVIAENVIEELTKSQSWEISENEARAITVQIMELESEELAINALEQLQMGSSFQQVYVNLFGENPIDYTIVRGNLIPVLEEEVYLLESGEYTNVLKDTNETTGEEHYFIAYCVNDYLPDLTQTNRVEIQNQKKIAYWMPIVEEKRNTLELYIDERTLKKENFDIGQLEASFYDIYNQFFAE